MSPQSVQPAGAAFKESRLENWLLSRSFSRPCNTTGIEKWWLKSKHFHPITGRSTHGFAPRSKLITPPASFRFEILSVILNRLMGCQVKLTLVEKTKLLLAFPNGVLMVSVKVTLPFTALAETQSWQLRNFGEHHSSAARLSYPSYDLPSSTFNAVDIVLVFLFPTLCGFSGFASRL